MSMVLCYVIGAVLYKIKTGHSFADGITLDWSTWFAFAGTFVLAAYWDLMRLKYYRKKP